MALDRFKKDLEDFEKQGNLRQLHEIQGPQGRLLEHDGRTYLNFSSNNYLGLANEPVVAEAFLQGVRQWGVGAGAARLVNGSLSPFHQLERALAEFKGTDAALLFNSGYHANVGALSCLAEKGDVIFSDELNHASMIDGIRLSKAHKVIYPHNNLKELREKLKVFRTQVSKEARLLIASESVFSMDGDLCDLKGLLELTEEFDAFLYLDEAHATGVFGERGSGLLESFAPSAEIKSRIIQMGTLGKALGCFGAYVAASKTCIDFLINRARTFIYTTALPPALAEAALAALSFVVCDKERRVSLWQRMDQLQLALKRELPALGVKVASPIVPIILGESQAAVAMSKWLKEQGFWINAIRPPTVPDKTSRLRITLMATHTEEDIHGLVAAIKIGLKEFAPTIKL